MKKFLIVFGTRPEAIKMAPIVKELMKYSEKVLTRVCVTAQHREMLDQVLKIFGIEPDYDLNIMRPGQSLAQSFSSALCGLETVLREFKPDTVIVQGDTTTTLAASLASYFQTIDVAHVEAGLRTGDIYSPWPEEMNRKATSLIAKWHFAPTEGARQNLLGEGVEDESIKVTGNTVIDALSEVSRFIDENKRINERMSKQFSYLDASKRLILVTGHRRESFGAGFENICGALKEISETIDDVELIFPVHLNPSVREPVHRILGELNNVYLIEPLEYTAFVYLMRRSFLIITDSGGIQEEAPSLDIPVMVTREVTERPEAIESGAVMVVGSSRQRIVAEVSRLMNDKISYRQMTGKINPYGDGKAASRIVNFLLQ